MPQPYFLMSLLYLSLVVLSWLASILTGLEIIPIGKVLIQECKEYNQIR
jgi:hypothetical protein